MTALNRIIVTISKRLETYFELPVGDGDLLASKLEIVNLESGQTLFHQGDDASALYLLVRGRLQVWIEADKPI